jgi:hypothetical protein
VPITSSSEDLTAFAITSALLTWREVMLGPMKKAFQLSAKIDARKPESDQSKISTA